MTFLTFLTTNRTSDRDRNDFLKTDDRNHFLNMKIDDIFVFLDHISKKVEKHLFLQKAAAFSKEGPPKESLFSRNRTKRAVPPLFWCSFAVFSRVLHHLNITFFKTPFLKIWFRRGRSKKWVSEVTKITFEQQNR